MSEMPAPYTAGDDPGAEQILITTLPTAAEIESVRRAHPPITVTARTDWLGRVTTGHPPLTTCANLNCLEPWPCAAVRAGDAVLILTARLAAAHQALALFADEANWRDERWTHPHVGVGLARRALRESGGTP